MAILPEKSPELRRAQCEWFIAHGVGPTRVISDSYEIDHTPKGYVLRYGEAMFFESHATYAEREILMGVDNDFPTE